ncbi:MAG: hypothetical protein QMD22_10015 [archaeon]|nr:hypothetical protein [archaeon]
MKRKMEIPYEALSLWEALCLCRHHENAYFDADKRVNNLPLKR